MLIIRLLWQIANIGQLNFLILIKEGGDRKRDRTSQLLLCATANCSASSGHVYQLCVNCCIYYLKVLVKCSTSIHVVHILYFYLLTYIKYVMNKSILTKLYANIYAIPRIKVLTLNFLSTFLKQCLTCKWLGLSVFLLYFPLLSSVFCALHHFWAWNILTFMYNITMLFNLTEHCCFFACQEITFIFYTFAYLQQMYTMWPYVWYFQKWHKKHFQDFIQILPLRKLSISGSLLLFMSYFSKTHTQTNLDK